MKTLATLFLLVCACVPSWALKNRRDNFPEACDVVWKAVLTVAKTQDYRIISVTSEEQIISLSVGGIWWGERIISLSLAPGTEHGCTATVQSRYSGVQHSDSHDLLSRIHVELIGNEVGRDSKAFHKFKSCLSDYDGTEAKCEEKMRKTFADSTNNSDPRPDPTWWNKQSQ